MELHKIQNETKSQTVVFLLHGFGADESDLFDLKELFPNTKVISLRAPVSLLDYGYSGGYAWFPLDFTPWGIRYDYEGLVSSLKLLTEEIKLLSVGYENIYLCGFSQGAIMAHGIFLQGEIEINGIAALSGRFTPEIFKEDYAKKLTEKKVFISHGIYDEVIPVSSGQQIRDFYKNTLAELTYFEFDMGHEINYDCQENLADWFENSVNKNGAILR